MDVQQILAEVEQAVPKVQELIPKVEEALGHLNVIKQGVAEHAQQQEVANPTDVSGQAPQNAQGETVTGDKPPVESAPKDVV